MTGWLVANAFLRSEKFDDLYRLLIDAFRAQGDNLELYPNSAFASPVDEFPRPRGADGRPDFVLFWDKDVALARRFEDAGLRVFNTSSAIAVCDDKIKTALAFARCGVPAPRTIFAPMTFDGVERDASGFLHEAAERLGLPMVVKTACGSFGHGVHLAGTLAEAEDIVRGIGCRDFLVQEFVSTSRGEDLRVNVVGGEVVASMRRFNRSDFRSNVTLGGGTEPCEPSLEQREAALAACRATGTDFAGVDILFGQDGAPLVCEVNSNPHFRSTLDCTGVNLAGPIARHVRKNLQTSRNVNVSPARSPQDAE